jgi:hypothetical protein
MASIVKSISVPPANVPQRLGFSVWARGAPKQYLSEYGSKLKKAISSADGYITTVALVDDVLPRVILNRPMEVQQELNEMYLTQLPLLGFDEVHLVSTFLGPCGLWDILKHGLCCSTSEFQKLLPQSKKGDPNSLTLDELSAFLWHVRVIEVALEIFNLSGFVAGIRSEFFYLTCRRLTKPFSVYFLGNEP